LVSIRAEAGNPYEVAILPGALASSLGEDTEFKQKTMVEIGGKPILWHILIYYAHYGHEVFVIGLGHRGEVIKKYMLDYCSLNRDLSVSLKTGKVRMNAGAVPDWMLEHPSARPACFPPLAWKTSHADRGAADGEIWVSGIGSRQDC
jgi:hypothetical protein